MLRLPKFAAIFSIKVVLMIYPQRIIENIIREAIEKGEFDNLPGKGKPLVFEDDSHVPEDLRLAYKILKNADCIPPELQLKKDIRAAQDLLSGLTDEKEKYRQMKKLNFLVMKLNTIQKRPVNLEENQIYYEKLLDKMK
jgi:hypothetical protein